MHGAMSPSSKGGGSEKALRHIKLYKNLVELFMHAWTTFDDEISAHVFIARIRIVRAAVLWALIAARAR